jgi:SAM-dependent methyltransferase
MRSGWFKVDGLQDGDRTLADQLTGLEALAVRGKRVIDLGCAEGLISRWCVDQGAASVYGVEVVPEHVETARKLAGDIRPDRLRFFCGDLNKPETCALARPVDVVLALAILHKLREPENLLRQIVAIGPELVVVRTPGATPRGIQDERSGNRWISLADNLPGYALVEQAAGHFDPTRGAREWVGYYLRDGV